MKLIIDNISTQLATMLKQKVPEHRASIKVLKFSIAILINTLSIILLTFIISLFTGNTSAAMISLISFALLRQVSGGIHLNSGDKCVIVTTTMFTIMSLITLNQPMILTLGIISLILVLIFAPSSIEQQSRIPKKYYPLLKLVSFIVVLLSIQFTNSSITLAIFAQSVTLINLKGGEI